MTIAVSRIASGYDGSGNSTDIVVSSFTPAANAMLLFIMVKSNNDDSVADIVGHETGGDWVEIYENTWNVNHGVEMWGCFTGASPSAGTVTIDRNYTWHQGWELFEITGVDVSGTVANVFVQTVYDYEYRTSSESSYLETQTLAAFASATNAVFFTAWSATDTTWATHESPTAEFAQVASAYENRSGYINAEHNAITYSFSAWGHGTLFAVELRRAAAGGAVGPPSLIKTIVRHIGA